MKQQFTRFRYGKLRQLKLKHFTLSLLIAILTLAAMPETSLAQRGRTSKGKVERTQSKTKKSKATKSGARSSRSSGRKSGARKSTPKNREASSDLDLVLRPDHRADPRRRASRVASSGIVVQIRVVFAHRIETHVIETRVRVKVARAAEIHEPHRIASETTDQRLVGMEDG